MSIGSTLVGVLIGCLSGFTTKQATKGSELEAKAIKQVSLSPSLPLSLPASLPLSLSLRLRGMQGIELEEAGVETHFEVSIVLLFACPLRMIHMQRCATHAQHASYKFYTQI